MIHYIYRIDFLCGDPGRYYLGKRTFRWKNVNNDSYAGSGDFCKEYYNKYGKICGETYNKTILEINNSWEINRQREEIIVGDLWKTDPLCMNMCPGGGYVFPKCKPVIQYDLNGNIIAKFSSVAEAEDAMQNKGIRQCCCGHKSCWTAAGFVWRFEGDSFNKYYVPYWCNGKKDCVLINQYTIKGEFVKTWKSARLAANAMDSKCNGGSILRCIANPKKNYTCYGYRWSVYNGSTDNLPPLENKQIYKVLQYDLDNNFINIYNNCAQAAKSCGRRHGEGIKRCAEGLQESCYGYKWKIVNE